MNISMKTYLYVNALSSLGSRMDLIACSALIFTFDNGAFWLAAFFVARQIGGILFSPLAGILADRVDRRRAMIVSDLGAGLSVILMVVFPVPLVVIAAAFLKGMLYTLFHISFQASLPQMFEKEDLVRVNGWTVRLESVVGIVGFALGGFLTDHLGYAFVIACDAVTFLFSAAILTRLRWNSRSGAEESAKTTNATGATGHTQEPRSLRATLVYLAKQPLFLVISLLALFESISTASHNFGLPALANQFASGHAVLHGLMWSAMSEGAAAGAFGAARWRGNLLQGLLVSSSLLSLVITAAFAGKSMWLVLALLVLAGLLAGASQVYESTLLQQADNRIRGRVMGVQGLLSRVGFFIGFMAAPALASSLGLFGMVMAAQLVYLAGVVGLGWFCLRKG